MSSIVVAGDTSGSVTLSAPAVSGTSVLTLPVATDTLVGKATTDTLTNKTLTTPTISSLSSASATALTLQSAGTTAITVDTSQNVGIGTTSASGTTLTVKGTTANTNTGIVSFFKYLGTAASPTESVDWPTPVLSLRGYGDFTKESMLSFGYSNDAIYQTGDGVWNFRLDGIASATSSSSSTNLNLLGPGALVLGAGSAERMRIDSSGNVMTGATSATFAGFTCKFSVTEGSAYTPFGINNNWAGVSASNAIIFARNGTQTGSIQVTGTTTSYVTSSDYRLKEAITPMTGALAKVAALKPVTYKWKLDGSDAEGFIAHELAEVVPDCVIGDKDAVNEDGSIKPQGIDTSFLVATLTAAIQELKAIIDTQAERIKALEELA